MPKIKIAPSLLSADMARFSDAVEAVSLDADYIHCDVMDGHFVPNLTFGAPVVKAIKRVSDLPLDVHLMIEVPGRWVEDYIKAGLDSSDFLTFHIEAESDPRGVIDYIRRSGVRPGISIKPDTPFEDVARFIPLVDQLLVMTVEPGFGGQSFRDMTDKMMEARRIGGGDLVIGVDGGVDPTTAPKVAAAGADLLIAGSAVYGRKGVTPVQAIREIRWAIEGN